MPDKSQLEWGSTPLAQLPIPSQLALFFVADHQPRILSADSISRYGTIIRPYIRKFQVNKIVAIHQGNDYTFLVTPTTGHERTISYGTTRCHSPAINDIPRFIAWVIKEAITDEREHSIPDPYPCQAFR